MARRFFVRLVGNLLGSVVAWLLVGQIPAWIAAGFIGDVAYVWAGFVALGLIVSFPSRMREVMHQERREYEAARRGVRL